jgi:hypothetical protein
MEITLKNRTFDYTEKWGRRLGGWEQIPTSSYALHTLFRGTASPVRNLLKKSNVSKAKKTAMAMT